MALKFFGTDGIRGTALASPLTLEECVRWGCAWSQVAKTKGISEIVIAWDPRLSSEGMAQAFVEGMGDLKAEVLGMVPTPALAWVTQRRSQSNGAKSWGLMISASHNPPEDNGIKGFNSIGEKLSEEEELSVEAAFIALEGHTFEKKLTHLQCDASQVQEYVDHLQGLELPEDFKLVIDCAHGATSDLAPKLFHGPITWLGYPADGHRINVGVGSTHLEGLQAKVRELGAQAGVAFDGDGDRCLFVDSKGEVVDGDQLLWLLAMDRKSQNDPIQGVVGTVMSNGGLEEALQGLDLPLVRTPVGDKFMLRELGQRGWDLAAEASGHVIQKNIGPSGDGLATALSVIRALLHRKKEARWSWCFKPWPLKLVNLVAKDRKPLEACTHLQEAEQQLQSEHGLKLRMVLRWSGTEPKLRLMVEAQDQQLMETAIARLESAARLDLGMA